MKTGNGWSPDDWYRDGEGQLHFFSRQKVMIWTVGKRIAAECAAWGGRMLEGRWHDPIMSPRPTTPGTYVIRSFGPYRTRTWPMSRLPWGTPLKVDSANHEVLYRLGQHTNRWRRIGSLIPGLTTSDIQDLYWALYADSHIHDRDGDGIPDTWVFNDFGPFAVRYFRDLNRNKRLDGGENLMGEMIHTTPKDEADTARNGLVTLQPSHGCIHVKPIDRTKFLALGAFATGNLMIVHGPTEIVPEFLAR